MAERIVTKNLAGVEDLLLGKGTEQQIRNGYEYPITKLSLPWACSDIVELLELDTTKFTQALVSGIAYKYDGSAWVKVSDNTLREDLAAGGAGLIGPGVITRGADKFSIMQGRDGEQFGVDYTRGLGVLLADPLTGSGFTVNTAKINNITINDDRLNVVDDLLPGTKVDGLYVNHKFGGAGAKGGRHAGEFVLEQTGLTEATNTDRNYVGLVGYCTTSVGDGGLGPASAKGAYFGGNFFGSIKAGAANVFNVSGAEFNSGIATGASANIRTGIQVVGTGSERASVIDAAISIGNVSSAVPWRTAISVGSTHGGYALGPDGRVVSVAGDFIDRVLSLSSLIDCNHIIYHDNVRLTTQSLTLNKTGAFVSIGSPTAASTLQTVYRSSGLSPNYDARVLVSGGSATDGQGNYEIKAAMVTYNCTQRPTADNQFDYGSAAFRGRTAYFGTGAINTSDENEKSAPGEIPDAVLDAVAEVDWCVFQFLDVIEEKGADKARWHFGGMAQQFVRAFEKHGLDPYRFAFICYDEWEYSPEVFDDNGEIVSPAVEAGSRYGIRYDQAIILKQKQIERDHKRQIDALVSRIEALEAV